MILSEDIAPHAIIPEIFFLNKKNFKSAKMKWLTVFIISLIVTSCTPKEELTIISSNDFAFNYKDKSIKLFTLENENGLICQLTNFGARVVSIYTKDKNGNYRDIVLGYASGRDFVEKPENYFGATIGRYGNRIGNARFMIDGVEYDLDKNDGDNNLHGGRNGFHRQVWELECANKSTIVFSYASPDMESGFPGTVKVKVKYQLTVSDELKIEYFASSDKNTILNLTNHTYFNLKDAGISTTNNHLLHINADKYTPIGKDLISTGELATVEGTPFDFRKSTTIGDRVDTKHTQLEAGMGYDHNWVLNTNCDVSILAAKVTEPESGRVLEVYTNEPGIQFYGGNFLDSTVIGKNGIAYQHRSAFCLETQHFPDSPNKTEFPSVILDKGEEYYSVCIYKFPSL